MERTAVRFEVGRMEAHGPWGLALLAEYQQRDEAGGTVDVFGRERLHADTRFFVREWVVFTRRISGGGLSRYSPKRGMSRRRRGRSIFIGRARGGCRPVGGLRGIARTARRIGPI